MDNSQNHNSFNEVALAQIKLNHWTDLRSQQVLCVLFISCTLSCSQHVSALIKGHLQVILYKTKNLKESYIISTDPLSQYYDNRQMP
jgi:hypothetical protein